MDKRQDIRAELEELGAEQLRKWQGKTERPRLSPERLRALAAAAKAEVETEAVVRRLRPRPSRSWRWAAAAAVILLVGLAVYLLPNSPQSGNSPALALEELSESDILAYVEDNIDEFEWDLLEEALETEDSGAAVLLNELPDTAIESYLETADDWLDDVYY